MYKYIIALNNNCSYFGLICLCFNINEIEIYDETSTEAKLFNIDCIKPLDQFVVYSSEAVYRCSIRAKCNTTKMEFCNLDITVVAASDLKNVNMLIIRMVVFVEAYISSEPEESSTRKPKTHMYRSGGCIPDWNHWFKFTVKKSKILRQNVVLVISLIRVGCILLWDFLED